ncbi:MAG TPA: radical SAM protein [Rhizomicrobium sp.]
MKRAIATARSSLYINAIHPDMLNSDISRETAKTLFKKYVHDVELENHSYCNRTCWFCPNTFLDRRSSSILMTDEVFDKIISNLAEIDYSEQLEWSGYAEHFAEPSFIDRLLKAKAALPKARLIVFSNGDYLNKEMADAVLSHGIKLHVDIYPAEGDEFNEEKIEIAINKFRKRTELTVVAKDPGARGWGDYAIVNASGKQISSLKVGRYSKENIYTRAGAMDIPKLHTYQRKAACMKPVYHMNVNYDGKGMLCCHTRTDFEGHKDAAVADLSDPVEDLFSFFTKLAPARRALLAPGAKGGVCTSCNDDDGHPSGILARTHVGAAIAGTLKKLKTQRKSMP